MSDRRRRRLNDEGEDEVTPTPTSTSANPSSSKSRGERPSECESEEDSVTDLSESESAAGEGTEKEDETEEGSDTETEEGSFTEDASDSGTETEGGEDYTDEEGLDGERQSGDGQEQPEDDKPDDDEDKKNPAYVPRKGAFYEHDYRDGLEMAEEKEEPVDEKKLKKLWQDEGKWGHDFYRDDMQAPKSREELIALYGYDIRAADKPPEAPPMRRGRGRGQPRGERKIKDFLPRMAVIDTTEYGTDTVPTLDEDGLITYQDHKPVRGGRGRGNGYGRGNSSSPKYRSKDYSDGYSGSDRGDNRHYNKPQRENSSYKSSQNSSQDARTFNDYPSLDETRGMKTNKDYNRDVGYNVKGRDVPHQYGNQSNEDNDQSNSYGYDRNRKNDGNGRFDNDNNSINDSNNYNNRKGGDRNNSNYQQQHETQRRDNYRDRQIESNWRRGEQSGGDVSNNYNRDNNNRDRPGYQGGQRGGGRGGKARPYADGDDYQQHQYNTQRKAPSSPDDATAAGAKRGNARMGFDNNVPPRHQQQQNVDSREFTSSKAAGPVKQSAYTGEDRALPPRYNRNPVDNNNAVPSQGPVSGDGGPTSSSNNVVISNKENVQTINVTITSTTTEKKSYAKERRAKGTVAKAGEPQQGPSVVMGGAADVKADVPGNQSKHYSQPPPVSGSRDVSSLPMVPGSKRYSSQRQQQAVPKGGYNAEKPTSPLVDQGAKLYNPALPPPAFFQHDSAPSSTPAPSVPKDPQQRFNPSILPPGNPALSYGLPVPAPGIPIPAPTGSPNMFQGPPVSMGGPMAAGPALIAPPFIAPGMIYGPTPTPNPRVPPPATPVGFPIPLAYTAGPPPPPPQSQPPPASAVPPPVSQGAPSSVPGVPQVSTQPPKKVYRGEITYYAPELQQPSRATQKRPKSAIPIVDPQEMRQLKRLEKMREQQESDSKSKTTPPHQPPPTPPQSQHQVPPPPPEGSTSTTTGVMHSPVTHRTKQEPTTSAQSKEENETNKPSAGCGGGSSDCNVTTSNGGSKVETSNHIDMETNADNSDNNTSSSTKSCSPAAIVDESESNVGRSEEVKDVNVNTASETSALSVMDKSCGDSNSSNDNDTSLSVEQTELVETSHEKQPAVVKSSITTDAIQSHLNSDGDMAVGESNSNNALSSSSPADSSMKQESSTVVDNAGDADILMKNESNVVVNAKEIIDIIVEKNDIISSQVDGESCEDVKSSKDTDAVKEEIVG